MESYVERPPLPGLAGVVRTVWIQRTGEAAYVQRHLPTGGVEIPFRSAAHPQLRVRYRSGDRGHPGAPTVVGVRFQPGTPPLLPAVPDDLVDQRQAGGLWGSSVDRLVEAMAGAGTPERALMFLQADLLHEFRTAVPVAAAEVVPRMFRITICPGWASVRPSRRTIPFRDLRCDGGED